MPGEALLDEHGIAEWPIESAETLWKRHAEKSCLAHQRQQMVRGLMLAIATPHLIGRQVSRHEAINALKEGLLILCRLTQHRSISKHRTHRQALPSSSRATRQKGSRTLSADPAGRAAQKHDTTGS
jgi:hypothetical protein